MLARWERWAPLTGVVAIVVLLLGFIVVGGDTPDATDDSAAKIMTFYKKHDGSQEGAAFLVIIAAAIFLFFVGTLRGALARASTTRRLASISFGGGAIAVAGFFYMASAHFAVIEAAKHADGSATKALALLDDSSWPIAAGGLGLMVLGAGISLLVTRAFPLWWGIVTTVIGVAVFTPVGFFAILACLLWVIVMSIWLCVRPAAGGATPATTTDPAYTT
jgi:glucan phosphoethanolaminetransferase (alkaline phosphatase superfamily)